MAGNDDPRPRQFSSPPCLAHELDPLYAGQEAVDPQQALDVARWRKAERERLLAARAALPLATRQAATEVIGGHLARHLAAPLAALESPIVSVWWPINAELDLRAWVDGLAAEGVRAALPVVVQRGAPLRFRLWSPGVRLERGIWNIPVPAATPEVVPDIVLAPVVGWDPAAFRLGYGGGYFDRTFAACVERPLAIGIGLAQARIATIFPQPHDIPMAAIVSEGGVCTPST